MVPPKMLIPAGSGGSVSQVVGGGVFVVNS